MTTIPTPIIRFIDLTNQQTYETFLLYAIELYHELPLEEDDDSLIVFTKMVYALFSLHNDSSHDFITRYLADMLQVRDPEEEQIFIPLTMFHPHITAPMKEVSFSLLEPLIKQHHHPEKALSMVWYMYCFYGHCGGSIVDASWLLASIPEYVRDYSTIGCYDIAWHLYHNPHEKDIDPETENVIYLS